MKKLKQNKSSLKEGNVKNTTTNDSINDSEGALDRKDFLKKSLQVLAPAAVALSAAQACSPKGQGAASADELPQIKWNLTSSFPRGLDVLYGAAEFFVKRVKSLSNGKFIIRPYPAGELVPGLQVFDAIQQGTVEVGQSVSYYYIGKHPALAFDAGVPFGLDVRQQMAWMQAEGQKLLAEVFEKFNIVSLPMGNTGAQMGGWFRKPIKSLADLKGLRMRIPGLGGQVMSKLGVNVQNLAGGDIYSALERGAIDATEWVCPYDDEKLGFYKVAKNYYYPGWWEPSAQFSLYINKEKWDSLPKTYQDILISAAKETYMKVLAEYDLKNPVALQGLLRKGVKLQRFSDDILAKGKEVSENIMEQNAKGDKSYNKIYQSWKKYKDASSYWFSDVEGAKLDTGKTK